MQKQRRICLDKGNSKTAQLWQLFLSIFTVKEKGKGWKKGEGFLGGQDPVCKNQIYLKEKRLNGEFPPKGSVMENPRPQGISPGSATRHTEATVAVEERGGRLRLKLAIESGSTGLHGTSFSGMQIQELQSHSGLHRVSRKPLKPCGV